MALDVLPRPWERLAGTIAPDVLRAPRTAGDPITPGAWPDVHERLIRYLERKVVGRPWADQLALAAAVMSARRRDATTVRRVVQVVHGGFGTLFPALGLTTMADWRADHLVAYLKAEVRPHDRQSVRTGFWRCYNTTSRLLRRWLATLPTADRGPYQRFVLPVVSPDQVEGLIKSAELQRQQRLNRKAETDAVLPQFTALRIEAHLRYNRLLRLRQAFRDAARALTHPHPPSLPVTFAYDEGADPEHEVPPQERLHFRLWDRRSFVVAHADHYRPETVADARTGRGRPFSDARNTVFLEFLRAERLVSDAPPAGLWFEDLLRRRLLHRVRRGDRYEQDFAAEQAWLQAWGYGREGARQRIIPFFSRIPGLLAWSKASGDSTFMRVAQRHTDGVLIAVDSLAAAATLGLLGIGLFTTTGMRMNELMQVRLAPDAFVRLVMPAPPGAQDPSPRVRYAFRLIPKGERTNTPHTFFIGRETLRLLVATASMLAEHYALAPGAPLPVMPFNPFHGRAHRFGPASYLFQYSRQHLSDLGITACMRFLLHGMVFRTRDGKPVVLKAHLLRHAFATHAVHVEQIPVDIVGEWLKQKNLDVTNYYSQPTDSMVAEAADRYLARIAAHVHVGEAVRRSPQELREAYEAARGKVGTLAEVVGGHCVSHGFCAAKFACVGCAGKVPDPAKRHQVERHRAWAQTQIALAVDDGLYPEAERMKQLIRDCDTELQEMDQIDAYRRDAARDAHIHIAP
ncbi:MAG: site-specific integrase [Gemmatimonadetes bacterium]|nr:site-specific integrase [Gemmatimonadota bacterium]